MDNAKNEFMVNLHAKATKIRLITFDKSVNLSDVKQLLGNLIMASFFG